ncbi:MAG: YceI family protein [Paracoccaceae bacterium]
MSAISRRTMMAMTLAASLWPATGQTAPQPYRLDMQGSSVGFIFHLSGIQQAGVMPVQNADIMVDPQNLIRSTVDVELDVTQARTGLVFATQAMTGPDVLDAKHHPTIRFRSRSVTLGPEGRISNGATITGDVTIRGTTRPITLQAAIYRKSGSAPDDLSELTVDLNGTIQRSDFGASGYPDLVAEDVTLNIRAVIQATR